MSDFDKFFAKKLNEEGQFPRRERNWRALSKRLDAFNAGLQEHGTVARTYLRYWQAAATSAVVATGFLTWKTLEVQNENAALRREVAVLQEQKANASPPTAPLPTTQQPPSESENNRPVSTPEVQGKAKSDSPPQVFKPVEKYFENAEKIKFEKKKDGETLTNAVARGEKTSPENLPETTDAVASQTTNLANTETSSLVPDSANFQKSALLETPLAAQSDHPAIPDSLVKTAMTPPADSLQKTSLAATDTVAKPAIAQKIIEPVREKSRFRAGVQVVAGRAQPPQKGISLLTGQGLTAEFNVFRQFWLTASADWLRFDVSTNRFYKRFHPGHRLPFPPPNPGPQPPPPHNDLVKVESSQRRQYFGLGLRYQLPVHFWVRPSLSIAHTWVRVSPELVSFKYEDQGPSGPPGPHFPKYIVRKSEAQLLSNVWRFSAGLEHETPRWIFGLWADYSKNLGAADATFDALMLRAGVQYRFN